MDLGGRLRAVRTARRLTLEQLGQASGLPPGSLSRFERGRTTPSIETLERIAGALGMSVAALIADEEPAAAIRPELQGLLVRLRDRPEPTIRRVVRVVEALLDLEDEEPAAPV